MKYKAAIFDLDGTLLNTLDDLCDAVNATMDHYGYPRRTLAEVRASVGNGVERLIALSLPDGLDTPDFDKIAAYYRSYYAAHSEVKTAPYDGVLDLIDRLESAGVKTAVVSNKPQVSVQALCRHFFADFIDVAYGDSPDRPRKPAPDGTFSALERLGVPVAQAVFIGDGDADVETANNAGLRCIGVTWGFRDPDELRAAGAAVLLDSPTEMADYLLNL